MQLYEVTYLGNRDASKRFTTRVRADTRQAARELVEAMTGCTAERHLTREVPDPRPLAEPIRKRPSDLQKRLTQWLGR